MLTSRVLLQASARRVAQRFFSSPGAGTGTATPSVFDLMIDLTIVDSNGARKKIKGLIGKTLYEACESQGILLGPASHGGLLETRQSPTWIEPTFGEGSTEGFDHVVLTGEGAKAVNMPPSKTELQMLEDYWDFDEIFEGSRLASCITLKKEMDGMVVFVPDRIDINMG